MKNVIVGTAGHVDHGKTCLIKALTGVDTDRLREEQKRGITIELGFASLQNDQGLQIGIIDVPGHEKFVKNMLAGIGGIDLVLLVIGLDEGVMPQTVEHFEILKMLHIKEGIVVLTKADLVDSDWAELVEADVDSLLEGSFMEGAPKIRVSSYTGENIEALRQMVVDKVKVAKSRREEEELFRLPIDRVFTMDGFGTVITGTLVEGCCHVGQEVLVYPQEKPVKIRGIQVHGQKVDTAYAGQRTAINLVNIKKEELERGQIIAAPSSLVKSQFVDAKVQLFGSTERLLKNGDRVHLNYGSAQTLCKVVVLDRDQAGAKDQAYVQFRFDEPVAIKRGDRFIIRFYSPVETFGGGIVLDAQACKRKRLAPEVVSALQIKEQGNESEVLLQTIKEDSHLFPTIAFAAARLNRTRREVEQDLEALIKSKQILRLGDQSMVHKDYWAQLTTYGTQLLEQFHKENPILDGMDKEEFKSRILERFRIGESKKGDMLLQEMVKRGVAVTTASTIAATGFCVNYSDELSDMRRAIEQTYLDAGYEMPDTDTVIDSYKDKKQAKQIINDLVKKGQLVKINYASLIHKDSWDQVLSRLKAYMEDHKEISLGEFRDLLETSRKYAVLILEYCDQQKITKKQGDVRILL